MLAVKELIPLILFKMLVLQQLFNLSDEEVGFKLMIGIRLKNLLA